MSAGALAQAFPKPVLTADPPVQAAAAPVQIPAAPVPSTVQSPPMPGPVGVPSTSAATAQALPAKGATPVDASYVIGAEDEISVNVWKEASFSGSLVVRPDGMVSLPLLGDLPAAGQTPMQLSADIATRLKKYVTDPLVTVTVLAVRSKRIYLAGEVGRPGPMVLTPEMTPLQAIIAGGGLGQYANPKRVYILRKVNGKEQRIPFNYKTALKTGDMQGVVLLSGDTIVAQ